MLALSSPSSSLSPQPSSFLVSILGAVSGLSCGAYQYQAASGRIVFEATSTHGDSGPQNIAAMPLDRIMPALGIDSVNL
ncbi:hypothetical protein [Corynebacterium phoceense]